MLIFSSEDYRLETLKNHILNFILSITPYHLPYAKLIPFPSDSFLGYL
jgi:hypothetical protein